MKTTLHKDERVVCSMCQPTHFRYCFMAHSLPVLSEKLRSSEDTVTSWLGMPQLMSTCVLILPTTTFAV